MSEIRDKVEQDIIDKLFNHIPAVNKQILSCEELANIILAIYELAIVDRDAGLPLQNNKCALWDLYQKGWLESQQNMRLAGYVLEIKE